MYSYFAQFSPLENGGYDVLFPDLNGAVTSGETLDEALNMAEDLLRTWLETALNERDIIPHPSSFLEAKAQAERLCQEMGTPVPEGTFYQLVQSAVAAERPLRLNISMVPSMVRLIDDAARRQGMTRSGFLTAAARQYARKLASS